MNKLSNNGTNGSYSKENYYNPNEGIVSESSSDSAIFGSNYTYKLVFYPDAHPHYAEALEMTNDKIPEQIGKLIESFQPRVNQEFNQECWAILVWY